MHCFPGPHEVSVPEPDIELYLEAQLEQQADLLLRWCTAADELRLQPDGLTLDLRFEFAELARLSTELFDR